MRPGWARSAPSPGWWPSGLFRFAYARYMGGTLLAIATLGTLLHPAVAAGVRRRSACGEPPGHDHPVLADGGADGLQGPAVG